jgi:HAD superfamily hydrolase (TIGR01509 family)
MLKAVFFDMDGTITRPYLDFPALRALVGVPDGLPIMAHIQSLDPDAQARAEGILAQAEYEAATQAELNPGARELLGQLRARGLQVVIITNNHRRAMEHIVSRLGLQPDLTLSREDATAKPAPDLLQRALELLQLPTEAVVSVGDGRFDQLASAAAGIRYVHLAHDGTPLPGVATIHSLPELWPELGLEPPATPETAA